MGLHNLLPQNGEAPPCPRSRKFSQILETQPHECTEQPQALSPPYENSESPAFWDGEQAIRASVGSFRCRAVPSYLSSPRTSSVPMINLYSCYIRAQHSRNLPCTLLRLNALCPMPPHDHPAKSLLCVPQKCHFLCDAFLETSGLKPFQVESSSFPHCITEHLKWRAISRSSFFHGLKNPEGRSLSLT